MQAYDAAARLHVLRTFVAENLCPGDISDVTPDTTPLDQTIYKLMLSNKAWAISPSMATCTEPTSAHQTILHS
jgi:hypothetical protein